MKTIGLLGGMSWESSLEYYRIINERVKEKLGGLHSAKILMYSVDFAEIEEFQREGKWTEATAIMVKESKRLENAGADFLVICTNTMHKMAPEVRKNIKIPLLHIADPTAETIVKQKIIKVGLLGTKFTMEEDFYKGRLVNNFNLEVLIPANNERNTIHEIIYNELCLGIYKESSREKYKKIIDKLAKRGAEAVILGCTEISLLINQKDSTLPLFDTTKIHAETAADLSMN